jgi:hypothetical protein
MNPNNNKNNKNNTLVAADGRLQIINNTLINAAKSSANAWIKVQFESAVVLDSLSSMEDPKFVAWKAWKAYKSYGEDHRYVAWKRELDAEAEAVALADALALALALAEEADALALALAEEAKAEEDDSKYDELPLHERYTWYSTDEDDSDSEEDKA